MSKHRTTTEILRGTPPRHKGGNGVEPPHAAGRPVLPPAERVTADIQAKSLAEIEASAITWVIPLTALRIPVIMHGTRNPYTNPLRSAALRKLINESDGFKIAQCETLTVSLRRDGFYWIIDGVGRLWMADQCSGGLQTALECRVLTGLSLAQEVELFNRLGQKRHKITPRDAWLSHRGQRGHEDVEEIMRTVEQFASGKKLRPTLPTLKFGHAMQYRGEPALARSMAIVANTSLSLNRKLTNTYLNAISAILGAYGHVDQERLRHVCHPISKHDRGDKYLAGNIYTSAMKEANEMGFTHPHARTLAWLCAGILIDRYNTPAHRDRAKLDKSLLRFDTPVFDAYSSALPKPKTTGFVEGKPVTAGEERPGKPRPQPRGVEARQ